MSSTARARPLPGAGEEPPASSKTEQKARALGVTSATGLVIGSMIGTGVFTMPAVLAGAGTSSLIVPVIGSLDDAAAPHESIKSVMQENSYLRKRCGSAEAK
jgi:hypothetical protein